MAIENLQNPFEIKPPEELSTELISKLFVKEFTEHNALIGNYHTFIFGSRGSGKSMHFKYLEPRCQANEFQGLEEFLKSGFPFIGIYINCNKGDFTKQEFVNLFEEKELPGILIERLITHYFVMDISECTLKTFNDQLSELLSDENEEKVFTKIAEWLRLENTKEKSLTQLKLIFRDEKLKITDAIKNYYEDYGIEGNKLTTNIKRFADVSLEEGDFLYVLFSSLRQEVLKKETVPFYLLFDEANELLDFQRKIINTLITQRKHALVSVKVSCQPLMYRPYIDLKGRSIQETHDYYLIEMDSLYTTNKNSYYDRIKEIAERRLNIAGCKVTDIKKLIPENPADIEKIKKAEEMTVKEYESLPPEEKPKDKTTFVRKYAMARFFQNFLKKTSYGYSGFGNLVHFSSGIIRSFLEPLYEMLEEYIKRNPGIKVTEIDSLPYEIQREEIEKYSNIFIEKEIINQMRLEPEGSEDRKILEGLKNLLGSLGSILALRLKDEKSREPRIISFAIKESSRDSYLQKILDYGVMKAFFHQKWYRAKSGYEMLECFILNRRLCPRFHLDLSSFQGRLELSQDDLLTAIKDPNSFIKKFEKEQEEEQTVQMQLFDF